MYNRNLTNIHIALNWSRLGKYALARERRPSRRLRLAMSRRKWERLLPKLWRALKTGEAPKR